MDGLRALRAKRARARFPRGGRHLHEREHRDASELNLSRAAIDEQDDARDLASRRLDEIDRLLDASALGDDILRHHVAFALLDREAAHGQLRDRLAGGILLVAVRHLLRKDALDVQRARHLVSHENATHRRRDDAIDALAQLAALHRAGGHFATQLLGDARIAQDVRALEVAVGVELGPQLKMPFQQGAGVQEELEYLFLRHDFISFPLAFRSCQGRADRRPPSRPHERDRRAGARAAERPVSAA